MNKDYVIKEGIELLTKGRYCDGRLYGICGTLRKLKDRGVITNNQRHSIKRHMWDVFDNLERGIYYWNDDGCTTKTVAASQKNRINGFILLIESYGDMKRRRKKK